MNLTFCIPTLMIGGVEIVFLRTLHELDKYDDINITVLTHARITNKYFQDWFLAHPRIKLHVCYPWQNTFESLKKYTTFFPLRQIRKVIFSLYKKVKRWSLRHSQICKNTDIFIDYKNMEFFKELRGIKKTKIAWCHWSLQYMIKAGLMARFDNYDKLVALTDSFVAEFQAAFPQYANRIVRIYNPIDCDAIRHFAQNNPVMAGKYFLVVSRLVWGKDVETVLNAFNKFWTRENSPEDVHLIVVGDGHRTDELKHIATEMPAGKNIYFMGAMMQPFGYMRGALANILSSNSEGLPTVLIESMAVGTLNISSDCPNGPAEILMNGDAGLLFTPGNADELARCMSDVWNENIDIQKMTENAARGLERFTVNTVIPGLKQFLAQQIKKENS